MATFHTGYRMNNHPIIIVYFILLSWPKCVLCICFFWVYRIYINSLQFSCSVMYISLWPHGLQQARLPCTSPTPGAYPNSCPLSQWCHPTVPSCRPLLLLPSIFPIIRVFSNESALHIRWPKYWSFSFNISTSNEHPGLPPSRWTGWISLQSVQGTLKSHVQHHSSKASILQLSVHDYWKNHSFHYMDFCQQNDVSAF